MLRVLSQIEEARLSREDPQVRHGIRRWLRVLAEDRVLLMSAVIYHALGRQCVSHLGSCKCSGHAPEHPFVEAVNVVAGTRWNENGHSRADDLNPRLGHIRQVRRDLLPPRTARNQSNQTHQLGLPFHSNTFIFRFDGNEIPEVALAREGHLEASYAATGRFRRCGRITNRLNNYLACSVLM